MSKSCVHCEKKIGFFQTPIEGAYCSYDCRNAARDALLESQRQSHERIVEAQRRVAQAAAESARQIAVSKAEAQLRGRCPKCSEPWAFVNAGSSSGTFTGKCSKCLFTAEFVKIDPCPVCKCQSLVFAANGDARCPRCKYRCHVDAHSATG